MMYQHGWFITDDDPPEDYIPRNTKLSVVYWYNAQTDRLWLIAPKHDPREYGYWDEINTRLSHGFDLHRDYIRRVVQTMGYRWEYD